MKPRLKLTLEGRLVVLVQGQNQWNAREARGFCRAHYGSLQCMAERFGLSYRALCVATRGMSHAERWAGDVAQVRQLLGLPSNPSDQSLRLASWWATKRAQA